MSDTEKKVKAFIIRDFHDDGTKERFTANETPEISAGAFKNYEAAGLVRKATADDAKNAAKPDAKTGA